MYQPGIPTGVFRTIMRGRWSPLVDANFGEMLMIQPMVFANGKNAQQQVDPTRPVITVVGVFRAPREAQDWGQADAQKQRISLDKPTFSIALAALPFPLRRGDVIVRCEQNATYAVRAMKADPLKIRGIFEVEQMGIQESLGGNA